jgi:hypothetical protein
MRIRTILAGCAFASLWLASYSASANSIEDSNFSSSASSFTSQDAYARGLWLQGAAPGPQAVRAVAWAYPGAAPTSVVLAYNTLTSPASPRLSTNGEPFEASSPLPGAGVVGLIALLAIAARRDLLG